MAKRFIHERLDEFYQDNAKQGAPLSLEVLQAAQLVIANTTDKRLDEIEALIEQKAYEAGAPRRRNPEDL